MKSLRDNEPALQSPRAKPATTPDARRSGGPFSPYLIVARARGADGCVVPYVASPVARCGRRVFNNGHGAVNVFFVRSTRGSGTIRPTEALRPPVRELTFAPSNT